MRVAACRRLVWSIALLGALGPTRLPAQIGVGNWVRKSPASTPAMTLTVEACCKGGRRLTYHLDLTGTAAVLTIESRFDGSEAPVLVAGKPSGETMVIKRVDDHHLSTIVKINGKAFGTSTTTLSADGKTLTVLNDFTTSGGGLPAGKSTEIWVRK